ncbi:MAG: H/ACA snoRNP pseudouridylase subunit [Pleopsidium flavum]|nr:MAG: H/ACA snoRNP pseudouridylase subunit [Pleopsidium flavum]
MGSFLHACEGEIVCESVNPKIPYFNAPIYLENKTAIGKVDEILGPINQVYFTIKPQEGIVATSFKSGDKFYIGGDKLLPLENRNGQEEHRGEDQCEADVGLVEVAVEAHPGAEGDSVTEEEEGEVEEVEGVDSVLVGEGPEEVIRTSREQVASVEGGVRTLLHVVLHRA